MKGWIPEKDREGSNTSKNVHAKVAQAGTTQDFKSSIKLFPVRSAPLHEQQPCGDGSYHR